MSLIKKRCFRLFLLLVLTVSCQEKFVVLSSHSAYHTRTQVVYYMEVDTSLYMYDVFKAELPDVGNKRRKPLQLNNLIVGFKLLFVEDSTDHIKRYSKSPVRISEAPR